MHTTELIHDIASDVFADLANLKHVRTRVKDGTQDANLLDALVAVLQNAHTAMVQAAERGTMPLMITLPLPKLGESISVVSAWPKERIAPILYNTRTVEL